MNELSLQHIEGVAYHRGDKDIVMLVRQYRKQREEIKRLDEENARLRKENERILELIGISFPTPHFTVSAERLEEIKATIKEKKE